MSPATIQKEPSEREILEAWGLPPSGRRFRRSMAIRLALDAIGIEIEGQDAGGSGQGTKR